MAYAPFDKETNDNIFPVVVTTNSPCDWKAKTKKVDQNPWVAVHKHEFEPNELYFLDFWDLICHIILSDRVWVLMNGTNNQGLTKSQLVKFTSHIKLIYLIWSLLWTW